MRIVRLRPDGTWKYFYYTSEQQAESKLKSKPDEYFREEDFKIPEIKEDEKDEKDLNPDIESVIEEIVSRGFTREHALKMITGE